LSYLPEGWLVELKGKHDWPSIHPSIHSNEKFFACLVGFDRTVILNTSTYSHGLDWGNRWNIRVHMVFLIRIQNLVRSDSKNSVQKIQTQFITISILSQLFEYGSAPPLLALPYQGKDIVFRFIIEYSSLMDFGACVISLFL
jgi:hypothetical protein